MWGFKSAKQDYLEPKLLKAWGALNNTGQRRAGNYCVRRSVLWGTRSWCRILGLGAVLQLSISLMGGSLLWLLTTKPDVPVTGTAWTQVCQENTVVPHGSLQTDLATLAMKPVRYGAASGWWWWTYLKSLELFIRIQRWVFKIKKTHFCDK